MADNKSVSFRFIGQNMCLEAWIYRQWQEWSIALRELSKPGIQTSKEPDALERVVELSLLYDFYGVLLKEQKREIFEDYILNDLSLGEIAEERGISRQGVHDSIKRCSRELMEYEDKLGLIEKFHQIKLRVGKIHEIANCLKEGEGVTAESLEIITSLTDEILEEL